MMSMRISEAQREIRERFAGGFYGQLVSGTLWIASAVCASTINPRSAILVLVIGGMFIFPATELLVRLNHGRTLSVDNTLHALGRQVAFVLPASMPLLFPVASYRLNWFYQAMMLLLGAHYMPFVFLYGMRMFWYLAGALMGGGMVIAMYMSQSFSTGAWFTGVVLLVFAVVGRMHVRRAS